MNPYSWYRGVISSVLLLTFICCVAQAADTGGAPADSSPAAQPVPPSATGVDNQVILGTWEPKFIRFNGQIVEVTAADKIIFTPTDCTWRGMKYHYQLLDKQTPKFIVLTAGEGPKEKPVMIGLYELAGNALQMAVTEKVDEAMPPDFSSVPDTGFRMVIFAQEAAVERRWTVVRPQINKFLDKCISLLEAEKYLELAEFAAHRDTPAPPTPAELEAGIAWMKQNRSKFLATFRALKETRPERGFDENQVVFDVQNVEGGLPATTVTFKKIDDRWYLNFMMREKSDK